MQEDAKMFALRWTTYTSLGKCSKSGGILTHFTKAYFPTTSVTLMVRVTPILLPKELN